MELYFHLLFVVQCRYKRHMKIRWFSGVFILVFVVASFGVTAVYGLEAFSRTGNPAREAILKGTWAAKFEKNYGEVIPAYTPSRNLWGGIEFSLFRQGRKGVVIGENGWLFSDEEFSCLPGAAENMKANMEFIADVRDQLAQKGTQLAIVVVPAKARVYQDQLGKHTLPACRESVYSDTLKFIAGHGIPATDLLAAMQNSAERDTLYLKTDTHWTPQGARFAAQALAPAIDTTKIEKKEFATIQNGTQPHEGDLLRYLPGVRNDVLKPDDLAVVSTAESGEGVDDSALFSDSTPLVTLVGTSYSANELWNFEGFLKEALHADILNMADEGMGPFTVMDKYLASPIWTDTPPRLVIWEIPERYMTTPHTLPGNSAERDTDHVI